MRCTKCNYSLFDIRERICPECGEPFAISTHIFDHCGVRFCCPHCDQQYYGTDEKGHLVPIHFNCLTCHNHISMNQTIVRKPLHKVLHHRNVSSFPGFAGTILIFCAIFGAMSSVVAVADDIMIYSRSWSSLRQLPLDVLSNLIDILLVFALLIGGIRLTQRRPSARRVLLAWSSGQCVQVFAITAFTIAERFTGMPGIVPTIADEIIDHCLFATPAAMLLAILLQPRVAAIFEGWDRPPT